MTSRPVVIDTNVLVVANGRDTPQASGSCRERCTDEIGLVMSGGRIVIDSDRHILREYANNASDSGKPGLGDAFLLWILRNKHDSTYCEQVQITPTGDSGTDFAEFPVDDALAKFDPSDRKFVAVALASPSRPPILNAVDSDWREHLDALSRHDVVVTFFCPD